MPGLPALFPFRNPGVVRDLNHAVSLGLPVLSAIPSFHPEPGSSLPPEGEALDAYRRLADLVRVPDFHVRGRALVVTSAESGGRQPGIAAELAAVLAGGGAKVILVDADLRKAERRRSGSPSSGFAGLLVNQLRTPGSAVVHTLEPRLKLLPVGSAGRSPATLLRSPRLPLVMDQLRALTDHVILQLPSVLAWEDGLRLVELADATLLVVESGRTRRNNARQTAARLKEASRSLVGLVLDRVPATLAAPLPSAPRHQLSPAVPAPRAQPQHLELAVADLLADLEHALKLIRSLRGTAGEAQVSESENPARLAAIDR